MSFPFSTHKTSWIFNKKQMDSYENELQKKIIKFGKGCMTINEEKVLRRNYIKQMIHVCKRFKFPFNIVSCAVQLFKRFYLTETVMNYAPSRIYSTCILLASKAEEAYIRPNDLAKECRCNIDIMLNDEVIVMQATKFHLKLYHPSKSLKGFINTLINKDDNKKDWQHIETKAIELFYKLFLTDIWFYYNPSEIALAILYVLKDEIFINDDHYKNLLNDRLNKIIENEKDKFKTFETKKLKHIKKFIAIGKENWDTKEDNIISLENKLMKCRDNSKTPGTKEYEARLLKEEEEEMNLQIKRQEAKSKLLKKQADLLLGDANDDDDEPFIIKKEN